MDRYFIHCSKVIQIGDILSVKPHVWITRLLPSAPFTTLYLAIEYMYTLKFTCNVMIQKYSQESKQIPETKICFV